MVGASMLAGGKPAAWHAKAAASAPWAGVGGVQLYGVRVGVRACVRVSAGVRFEWYTPPPIRQEMSLLE